MFFLRPLRQDPLHCLRIGLHHEAQNQVVPRSGLLHIGHSSEHSFAFLMLASRFNLFASFALREISSRLAFVSFFARDLPPMEATLLIDNLLGIFDGYY